MIDAERRIATLAHTPHLELLRQRFEENYGSSERATLVVAPGRVNLMGDHIDYNGLSVLPMAIQRHMALLYRERDDRSVRLVSSDPRFPNREFQLADQIAPGEEGDWSDYARAACQAIVQRYQVGRGFDAVIHSDIPIAAGLASSSALLVASALAALHANDVWTEKMELAVVLAEAEHYVGTRGGGMDQAICLAARRHSASRIDFDPLRLTAHPIPPEWHFVIAFSLVRAEKSGAALETYNLRTEESGQALQGMTDSLGHSGEIDSYSDLLAEYHANELIAKSGDVLDETLMRRFVHVVTEGMRVRQAEKALHSYDMRAFGELMSESHESLRESFEVSTPELDELVEIAVRAGAVGARLTGAGLGGSVVALCSDSKSKKVLKALADRFYKKRNKRRDLGAALDDLMFVAEPSAGASVTPL
ncbi:MAG: galactokinase [Gemmatimonadetes bacterium]|uniref:Galactokinase n=1 Tax=Candidatus Kutchimonas denitrificans TaxID=3056748 RepID=A0AAE4Z755_9BACT|nr:galactokinase [Gemmatimonadota bacterium]NIR73962.1 galactokinase [Candidatus Kutchimonas denitrificans]NIS02951.1 galactokinase [Gemmatimonadota bacterium]NIT68668.1 galactokinase [Gemmatimonadota bacterium]NIU53249.1 galactokinase [Gemmatimonadota bacterium]